MNTPFAMSDDLIPAIPPDDYQGSIADWTLELKDREHLPADADVGDHVEVEISRDEWWKVLEACEGATA